MDVISISPFFHTQTLSSNPYKSPISIRRPQIPQISPFKSPPSNPLNPKLFLSSKLSPNPPPPPPPSETLAINPEIPASEFQQKGKIFVGNLQPWILKSEILDFFRQFGPIKNLILIRSHERSDRSLGFCFVTYGGEGAEEAAGRAVEVDGAELRGRAITVRLDDGSRGRERRGGGERGRRSGWHEERERACARFRRVLDEGDWQRVVEAFEGIEKVGFFV